jgi:hypothetical protein
MRALPSIYTVLGAAGQLGKLPGNQHVWNPHLLRLSTPMKTEEFLMLLIDCLVAYQAHI